MTIHDAVFSVWRQPLLSVLFLALTGWMTLLIAAQWDGRSRRVRSALTAFFFLCTAVLWLCLCMISWENNTQGGFAALPAWLAAVGAFPVWALALAEAFLAVPLIPAAGDTRRYRDNHLTQDSIKETMDLLPVGIAFAEPGGGVVFRNLVMERLSLALTGSPLHDMDQFRAAAGDGPLSLDGKVWQFDASPHPDGALTELIATDITGQAGILNDLQEKNRKLRDIQLRLKIYNRQAERIITAQELLSARMTVHDELGHILLESRHYMSDPKAFNEAMLLQTLRNTNSYLLREYEQDDTARDALADAIDMAETIGVEVTITGRIPQEEPERSLLAAAIQESAANTVKHAGGSALSVQIRQEEDGTRFSLENNGRAPSEPIHEAGGLLSLRALTERRGGHLHVESIPVFRLDILLPIAPNQNKI